MQIYSAIVELFYAWDKVGWRDVNGRSTALQTRPNMRNKKNKRL
jgi:hypothetical protein